MSLILALGYPLGIQYERGGLWWIVFPFVTVPLWIIDIAANYTELALLTLDFPQKGEYTFSKRLKRLKYDRTWRGYYCAYVIVYLNHFAPNGKHV